MGIFNRNKGKQDEELTWVSFNEGLDNLNVKYKIQDVDENFKRYAFDFQGGHFGALARTDGSSVCVFFPNIFSVGVEDGLDIVRSVCNFSNRNGLVYKYYYETDEKNNTINVSISHFVEQVNNATFADMLAGFFNAQREFVSAYDNAIKEKSVDPEQGRLQHDREYHIIRQLEMRLQGGELADWKIDATGSLTLFAVLTNLEPMMKAARVVYLKVITGELQYIDDEDEIKNFDLKRLIVSKNDEHPYFIREEAQLVLSYDDVKGVRRTLMMMVSADHSDAQALFFRVTVKQPSQAPSRHDSVAARENVRIDALDATLLFGVDKRDNKKLEQEFDYMWKEAQIKVKEGNTSELTHDQRLLCDVHDPHVGYCVYWGCRYLRDQRYYEAISHFESAYVGLKKEFFLKRDKDTQRLTYDVVAYLGLCYAMIECYKQAFFYLNIVWDTGRIDQAMEIVNVLCNVNDLRVFYHIDSILDDINRNFNANDGDELPDNIVRFKGFLHRRRAHALLQFNLFDDAKKACEEMLNDPECRDFAIGELKVIAERAAEQKTEQPSEQPKA